MTKKALLIGINEYAPPGGPNLRGCLNDVRDMAHTLNVLNIVPATPRTMRLLTDQRATRSNILAGLKWLVTGAQKGDVLVFYYSGHGSQVVDVSGDEIDHKDETLCPHDYAINGMIRDDELRDIIKSVRPETTLDVILDSCHSGTGTREVVGLSGLADDQAIVYRYVEPPVDYGYFLDVNPSIPTNRLLAPIGNSGRGDKEAVIVPELNHVLWAGCRDMQTSAEGPIDGGVYRGVFTYCLCKVLRRAGSTITRRRLDNLVCADIRRLGYGQVPQLEGTRQSLTEKVFT